MTQYGFYFDAESCIACHTCQVACKDTFNLNVDENFRTVRQFCTGSGFAPKSYSISMSCNHCEKAACLTACEQGALVRTTEGMIVVDDEKCDSCGKCIDACPYGAIVKMQAGGVGKCEGCHDVRSLGEEPACVASCPMHCIEFGPIEELRAKHSESNCVAEVAALPAFELTRPNLAMGVKECMTDSDFDEYIV